MVIPRNCMLRQGALWVGTRAPAREGRGEPGCRGGVGEGYYMYILYTENYNPGLRRAGSQRVSVPNDCNASVALAKARGILKGVAAPRVDYGKRASSVLKL